MNELIPMLVKLILFKRAGDIYVRISIVFKSATLSVLLLTKDPCFISYLSSLFIQFQASKTKSADGDWQKDSTFQFQQEKKWITQEREKLFLKAATFTCRCVFRPQGRRVFRPQGRRCVFRPCTILLSYSKLYHQSQASWNQPVLQWAILKMSLNEWKWRL